jgi:F0F1-type ATP synthase assembly protein I
MKKRDRRYFSYKNNRPWVENLQVVMQVGLTMAGSIFLCFYIGLTLDRWLGLKGPFIVIFIILGIIGGAVVVYRQLMEVFNPIKRDASDNGDGQGD